MAQSDFEQNLIEALQPVRGFALAQVLHFALHSPIWDYLAKGDADVDELAASQHLHADRLRVMCDYLVNEGFVARSSGLYGLTSRGSALTTFAPWYRLLVGGYAMTFHSIGATLAADAPYAARDGAAVGQGSCGISAYDAIPLIQSLLGRLPDPVDHLIDLGCGDGEVLLALAGSVPRAQLTGVDPHPRSIATARESAAARAVPAEFHEGDGATFVRGRPVLAGRACYVIAFVLQEILEQRGRAAVVDMVRELLASAADGYLIVVEVDWQIDNPTVMRHGLGLAYYNPYYLIHGLTEQRLESRAFWHEVVHDAGGRVITVGEVDPTVDSTTLEFGLLIGRSR